MHGDSANQTLPAGDSGAAAGRAPLSAELSLPRLGTFSGAVRLPGSKSIANRALLLAALSSGETRVTNLPVADDVAVLLRNLPLLGVGLRTASGAAVPRAVEDGEPVFVSGVGGPFPVEGASLMLDNAGTALRPLTAVLAAGRGEFAVDGDEQMRRRPIRDLVNGLRELGVRVECEHEGFPPLRIYARGLAGGTIQMSGQVSSQYISAMLLAAPFARDQDLVIRLPAAPVSQPYIDLTLAMMGDFGLHDVRRQGYVEFAVPHGRGYVSPGEYYVEGDASAATYFLSAGALPGCGPVRVLGLGRDSRQGDVRYAEVLAEMGAHVEYGPDWIETRGPAGRWPHTKLRAVDRDMNAMPDAALTLAVLALFADGESHIRNIANLRVKESERIQGLRTELEKLGARVLEDPDALHITAPAAGLRPARIETYRDHRMAMSFSLAAHGTSLVILNPGCVSKTYARFFDDFLPLAAPDAI